MLSDLLPGLQNKNITSSGCNQSEGVRVYNANEAYRERKHTLYPSSDVRVSSKSLSLTEIFSLVESQSDPVSHTHTYSPQSQQERLTQLVFY